MRYLSILVAMLLIALQSSAKTFDGIYIESAVNPQSLQFQEMKVKGKTIHSFIFQSPRGATLVQALPRDLYLQKRSELREWAAKFKPLRLIASDLACSNEIQITSEQRSQTVCMDRVTAKTQREFVRWVEETSRLTYAP